MGEFVRLCEYVCVWVYECVRMRVYECVCVCVTIYVWVCVRMWVCVERYYAICHVTFVSAYGVCIRAQVCESKT